MVLKFIRNQFRREPKVNIEKTQNQAVEYQGYTIVPTPLKSGAGWSTEGDIEWSDETQSYSEHFIRAETHPEFDQAVSHTITKGQHIIDEKIL